MDFFRLLSAIIFYQRRSRIPAEGTRYGRPLAISLRGKSIGSRERPGIVDSTYIRSGATVGSERLCGRNGALLVMRREADPVIWDYEAQSGHSSIALDIENPTIDSIYRQK